MSYKRIYATMDAYVNENSPQVSYGDNEFLRVGDMVTGAVVDSHVLMFFNINNEIPVGARIDGATLYMYLVERDWTTSTNTSNMEVSAMKAVGWNETCSWDFRLVSGGVGQWWAYPNGDGGLSSRQTVLFTHVRNRTDADGRWYAIGGTDAMIGFVQGVRDGTYAYGGGGIHLRGPGPGTAANKNAHKYASREWYGDGRGTPYIDVYYTEDTAPVLNTTLYDNLNPASVRLKGTCTSDGGDALIAGGFIVYGAGLPQNGSWHSVTTPTVNVEFTHDVTGLTQGASYTAYAYASNDVSTSLGAAANFTVPVLTSKSGDGGAGITSTITEVATEFSGGGGGGHAVSTKRGTATHGAGAAGVAGTSGRGGGGGAGAAGGKGRAAFRYSLADAIAATPELSNDIFKPALSYHNGRLYAPYADSTGLTEKSITAASVETGVHTHCTCTGHGIASGFPQVISITNSTGFVPSLNGVHLATYVDANTFSLDDVDITVGTGSATMSYNHLVGYAHSGDGYENAYIKSSRSSFHTGSLPKDFRYISIIHEPLPATGTLKAAYTIDDVRYPTSVVVDGLETAWLDVTARGLKESRLAISKTGFEIDMELALLGTSEAIRVKGYNVVWNFIKIPKHLYSLDLRDGAGSGRWDENPEEAIRFLFQAADVEAQFEDRYSGEYTGTVEEVEYTQSGYSLEEGPSGQAKILVREVS